MKTVTAQQMQSLDQETIQGIGIQGLVLMENAGRGTAGTVLSCCSSMLSTGGAVIVAGPGNNGGDGFVIARHLVQAGFEVSIIQLAPHEKFRGDALVNLEITKKLGIPALLWCEDQMPQGIENMLSGAGVIVDAIFGTGLGREVKGRFAQAIELVNRSAATTVAVDIASGLSADTGHPLGCAVRADITCAMAMPKIGHITWPGSDYTGELHVIEIGIPGFLVEQAGINTEAYGADEFKSDLVQRPAGGHKGTFGHVVIAGGSRGKTGAAVLAAIGALHSGAGLVTVASAASSQPIIAARLTEAMTCVLPETTDGTPCQAAWDVFSELIRGKRAVVAGPGMGIDRDATEFARRIVIETEVPVVVDADALTAMVRDMTPFRQKAYAGQLILTPHPGEMARLCGMTTGEVQADRLAAARDLATDTGTVVVLKGARTVTAVPDGRVWINMSGNAGMASGGMGDVLAGITGALAAQGYAPGQAARMAVFAHGKAADMLANGRGPWGWTAGEVAQWLPRVWGLGS